VRRMRLRGGVATAPIPSLPVKLGFPAYLTPSAAKHLLWDDPIRNIRWTFPVDTFPWLTYPNGNWWKGDFVPPQQIWYISFFVDRKGQVVLVPRWEIGPDMSRKGMASDALREE